MRRFIRNMCETNNSICLIGHVAAEAEYSHSVYGEAFFRVPFTVRRLSGTEDRLNLTVSERLLSAVPLEIGSHLEVNGQIRSYNKRTENGSRLIITVFARELTALDGELSEIQDMNEAELTGYICKKVVYRTTPFEREIADVLLAVNRRYGKSDYLPAIAWGRNARFLSGMSVGTALHVIGRLQSREYKKVGEDGTEKIKTAYEISCSAVEEL